jgi:hypothetical protein
MKRAIRVSCLTFLFVSLVGSLLLYYGTYPFLKDQIAELTWYSHIAECQSVGRKIILALDEYRKDNGSYPNDLKSIVPKYIDTIPEHTLGTKQWRYTIDTDEDHYELSFSPSIGYHYPCCYYMSKNSKWRIDE